MRSFLVDGKPALFTRERVLASGLVRLEFVFADGTLVLKQDWSGLVELPTEHRSLVPGDVLFRDRPRSFVTELHKTRLDWLLANIGKRVRKHIDKSGADPSIAKEPKPRKKKQSALEQLQQRLLELSLVKPKGPP